MDIMILGFLMIKGCTIYELKQMIGNLLSSAGSNSTGSIQAGLKKLLEQKAIVFEERQEKGLLKKVYFLTEVGKKYFMEQISIPMQHKQKNMELCKLFFMGFTPVEKRVELIDGFIEEMKKDLLFLEAINAHLEPRYSFDDGLHQKLQNQGGAVEFLSKEGRDNIASFQYASLDWNIDRLNFDIKWFEKLKKKISSGIYIK